jgi:malonate transporter and related proteins
MLDILAITGPIYFCIAVGFAVTRWGLFAKAEMRVLGKFVINLALPALLFNAISQRPLREVMHTDYLMAYAFGSFSVLMAGYAWARYVQRSAPSYRAYFAMGMSCSNSGYVGYPVAFLALGPVAGVALALNMVVENLMMLPVLMTLADADKKADGHALKVLAQTLGRLLSNPMILAILLGFAYSLSGLQLPGPVARTINVFAQATSALALSVIGGTLVGLQIKGMRRQVSRITFGKLILHPLAVWVAATWIVPIADPQLRIAAVVFAAMPMLGIFPIMAQRHGHEDTAAAALLVTTIVSFFTLSGLLWMLKHLAL